MIGFNLLAKKSGLNLALHPFVLQSVKWQSWPETMTLLIPPNMPCGRSPLFFQHHFSTKTMKHLVGFSCLQSGMVYVLFWFLVFLVSNFTQLIYLVLPWGYFLRLGVPSPVVWGQEAKVMNFYVPVPCVSAQSWFFARCASSEKEPLGNLSSWPRENGESDELKLHV